jgi:flagellar hook-basal body complex protein FliE
MSAGLATGQASAEDAIMALERARLAMQLASTVRTKSVEAIQDLLHTQV